MSQSRSASLIEQVTSTAFGFVTSFIILAWVAAPLVGFETDFSKTIQITMIFTAWSVIRGYGTRRFFNYLHSKGWLK